MNIARLLWGLVAGACVAAPAVAAKPPLELAPSSAWRVYSADASCQLTRRFGTGAQETLLRLESFDVNKTFIVLVGGKPLLRHDRDRLALTFGPNGRADIRELHKGSVTGFEPGVYSDAIPLLASEPNEAIVLEGGQVRQASESRVAESAMSELVQWLEISSKPMRSIRLLVGDMAAPLAEMRRCSENHPAQLGLDDEMRARQSKPPVPTGNPAEWLTRNDYPVELLRQGAQGRVYFRVRVDAQGVPSSCDVLKETRPPGFGIAVCAAMMRRARFTPALSSSGVATEGLWRSSARFQFSR